MADQTIISAEDLVVTGNLKVSGSQISTTSTDVEIKDNRIIPVSYTHLTLPTIYSV